MPHEADSIAEAVVVAPPLSGKSTAVSALRQSAFGRFVNVADVDEAFTTAPIDITVEGAAGRLGAWSERVREAAANAGVDAILWFVHDAFQLSAIGLYDGTGPTVPTVLVVLDDAEWRRRAEARLNSGAWSPDDRVSAEAWRRTILRSELAQSAIRVRDMVHALAALQVPIPKELTSMEPIATSGKGETVVPPEHAVVHPLPPLQPTTSDKD